MSLRPRRGDIGGTARVRKESSMTRKLFVLNGPNLNMLGVREPELYGTASLDDVRADCERVAGEVGFELFFAQSNAEHELVQWVHDAFRQQATVVINPAGF